MGSRDIGFEIFFKSVCMTFKNKNDALVTKIHWILLQNGFKCIGSGGDIKKSDGKSELLPSDWNNSQDLYQLKYIKDDRKYLLKIVISSDNMLIHINKDGEKDTFFTQVRTDEYVGNDFKNFEKAYQNINTFDKKVLNELIHSYVYSPMNNPGKSNPTTSDSLAKTSSTITTKPDISTFTAFEEEDFFKNTIPSQPPHGTIPPNPANQPFFQPPSRDRNPDLFPDIPTGVGRGDLDPLGRSEPGMLFDPSRNMGPRQPFNPNSGLPGPDVLPRGAIPPGARFDPFGPDLTQETRPDHMRPFGSDDAYM